ncbi:MAG: hypothetical protein AAB932_05755, partial [Patescibacteria group bacterium]
DDHFAFEIVAWNGLVYFYVDVPKRMRTMIEQQIHAQYPYAEIDEVIDYNMFTPQSAIVGAYMTGSQKHIFPFKTYKEMESDPLSGLLNVFAKVKESNSSAAAQFVVRSAHKRWRRKGVSVVREVRKGKKFEKVARRSTFVKVLTWITDGIEDAFKKKDDKPHTTYQLSPMEEEMLKGIEKKMSKGGLDATIRLLSSSDSEETARLNLDNIINAFSQYNLYRFGNSFSATVPKNQSLIIRDFIFRSFHESRKVLVNTEEMASLWHLPLHSTEAPNIKWLSGRRAPPPVNIPTEGLLLGHVPYRGIDTPIYQKETDRRRHLYVIGKSGTGKSVLLSSLAIQDI